MNTRLRDCFIWTEASSKKRERRHSDGIITQSLLTKTSISRITPVSVWNKPSSELQLFGFPSCNYLRFWFPSRALGTAKPDWQRHTNYDSVHAFLLVMQIFSFYCSPRNLTRTCELHCFWMDVGSDAEWENADRFISAVLHIYYAFDCNKSYLTW